MHNLLARERSLGLHLFMGLKRGAGGDVVARPAEASAAVELAVVEAGPEEPPVTDLPLFGQRSEERR